MGEKTAAPPPADSETTGPAIAGLTMQTRLLSGLLMFSLAMTLGLLFWSARTQDSIAAAASRHLADTVRSAELSSVKNLLTDYTLWDDAYKYTVKDFDPDFFDENFGDGAYLRDTFGITIGFIISPDNRILRLMLNSQIVDDAPRRNFLAQVGGGLDLLVQQARRPVDGEFLVTGGLVKVAGQMHFAAARIINPHTPDLQAKTVIAPGDAHVGIFMRPLDDELLNTLANDFALGNLSYANGANLAGNLTLPLNCADGQQCGALAWQIELPSHKVLFHLLPALLVVILFVGLFSWYVLTSLNRGQAELWQAMQQAQSADRIKTHFLANMSHELRTPLNAIIGFSEMMQVEMFGSLGNKRYAEYTDNIHDSGRHLLDIIDDVLELSKVESGTYDLHETEVPVPEVIEFVRRLTTQRIADKHITLAINIAPNLPDLLADERTLKQILLNLVSNAVKFTPNHGHVAIDVTHQPGGPLRLSVTDTGVGIPAEELASVMQPFHQVARPMIASEGGTGLGLPLTAALVALHGGEIHIDSEIDQGTSILVDFPADRAIVRKIA